MLSSFEGICLHSLVMMAERSHPFPYRTRKLSSLAPMVVVPVRVGRRHKNLSHFDLGFCVYFYLPNVIIHKFNKAKDEKE